MVGIDPALVKKFAAERLARWFGPEANLGEVRCRYRRSDNDLTS